MKRRRRPREGCKRRVLTMRVSYATMPAEVPQSNAHAGRTPALEHLRDASRGHPGRVSAPAPDSMPPRAQQSRLMDASKRPAHRGSEEGRPRAMLLPSTCPFTDCHSPRRHLGRVRRQPALAPADTSAALLHQCQPRPLRAPGRPARSSGRPWPGGSVVLAQLESPAEPVGGDGLPAVKVRTCDSSPRADASRLGARSVAFSR